MALTNKLFTYLKESKEEVKKVTWPTKKEIKQHTLLVIGISLGVAVFLGAVDYILTKIFEIII